MVTMKAALDTEEKPFDATNDTVMPGVLQMHKETHLGINKVEHKVTAVTDKLNSLSSQSIAEDIEDISPNVIGKVNDMHHLQRLQLGRSFLLYIANQLMGQNMMIMPSKQEEELKKRVQESCFRSTSAAISNLTDSARPSKRRKTMVTPSTVNTEEDNTNKDDEVSMANPTINVPVEELPLLCPVNKHKCLSNLYNKWFGIGKFFL